MVNYVTQDPLLGLHFPEPHPIQPLNTVPKHVPWRDIFEVTRTAAGFREPTANLTTGVRSGLGTEHRIGQGYPTAQGPWPLLVTLLCPMSYLYNTWALRIPKYPS